MGFLSAPWLFRETKLYLVASADPRHLQQTCAEEKPSPATETSVLLHIYQSHKLFLPHIHKYSTLLVSHSTLSSEIVIFYYSFSFLLPFLMAEWNPGKQTKTPSHAVNILQNQATSWLHLKLFTMLTQHKPTQTCQCRVQFQEPQQPKSQKPKPHRFQKTWFSTFASSLHQSSFLQTPAAVTRLWRNAS